jgi:hypothetical protein
VARLARAIDALPLKRGEHDQGLALRQPFFAKVAARTIIAAGWGTPPLFGHLWAADGGGITYMRSLFLILVFAAFGFPCFAQNVLRSEPLVLPPYEVAYVQTAACPAGKVLKVTGAIRGLHRKKACVSLASNQASRAAVSR